uniref:CCHC-type domain-containing protein n=1 Tax=Brassica oleracea TaxID=3712 RepID=A0A3P6EAV5_BRAOL|nr:unnamed protein product [Brassica oleracea]
MGQVYGILSTKGLEVPWNYIVWITGGIPKHSFLRWLFVLNLSEPKPATQHRKDLQQTTVKLQHPAVVFAISISTVHLFVRCARLVSEPGYAPNPSQPATMAQVTALVTAVAKLTAQQTVPAARRDRRDRNDQVSVHNDSDDDANPFAPLRQNARRREDNNDDSSSDDDKDDSSWKICFKLEIPLFNGSTVAEDLLDWFVTVEEILEFKNIPRDQCVPLIAIRFCDRAAAWWYQNKTTRARSGKTKIHTWDKLKREMQNFFLPYNYKQLMFQKFQNLRQSLRHQIQFTLNLFRPKTISEAHQQALTVEAQTRTGFSAWSSGLQTRSPSTTPASSSTPSDATTPKTETAIVPVDAQRQTRPGGFRCYTCGETGHRQSACPNRARRGLLLGEQPDDDNDPIYDDDEETVEELGTDSGTLLMLRRFIIDSGSSENVISSDAVKKISLPDEPHPTPYKIAWLEQNNDFLVTRRTMVSFSIGDSYHDKTDCDIVPMDACHLLLEELCFYPLFDSIQFIKHEVGLKKLSKETLDQFKNRSRRTLNS